MGAEAWCGCIRFPFFWVTQMIQNAVLGSQIIKMKKSELLKRMSLYS